ncbi:hypothetical protein IP86_18945 [Rhodopseudomonas sp. AAP120]|uniref:hypothetical protein n=1 Tax=Rhodopseudomonas sp. AAP120 TaxID=1523430 RepID=UPI0006B923DE|nr:hypothetical protein [Rhodopseudomonas sp. AAP120]KPF95484.1 hypothetical protein IP86_18945 [Rhodopseudomonas sp. AAP120]
MRFGSVLLLSAAWLAGAALAAEPGAPSSGPSDSNLARRSQQAAKDVVSEPLAVELAGARREIELLKHLSIEHERSERLDQELASARRELDTQTAVAAKAKDETVLIKTSYEAAAADLRRAAEKERERSEALAADLAKLRLELDANQARVAQEANKKAAELRGQTAGSAAASPGSSEDKDRIAALERDLAATRSDLDSRTTMLAKLRDEAAELKKISESKAADIKQATQKERERAEALAGQVTKLRAELQAERAQANEAAEEAAEFRRKWRRLQRRIKGR